ncbi:MAG TPA: GntG family PLP-dependent aldolase [Candidatus Hypogeohydataceae bacterium YC41]
MKIVDLRSDTVTKPTPKMLEAMTRAEVGDDGLGEDPTVNRLEEMAAERMDKEDGLFCASGTMANLIAVMTHTRPGDGVICDENAHIHKLTMGGTTAIAGVTLYTLMTNHIGKLSLKEIEDTINLNARYPRSKLLVVENTNNLAGGTILTPEETGALFSLARRYGLKFHLDGARIFNAAIALGVEPKRLTRDCDTVMFCLSKGLSCPIGSILTGPSDFIKEARRFRKMLGGVMRQVGVVAACGIVALQEMVDRLTEDHQKARRLAEGLENIRKGMVRLETVHTNIVCFEFSSPTMNCMQLVDKLGKKGVLALHIEGTKCRMVTHKEVSFEDIDYALGVAEGVLKGVR